MKSIKQLILTSFKKLTILTLVFTIGFIQSVEFKIDVQATSITSNPFESLDLAREARIQSIQNTQNETSSANTYRTRSFSSLDNSQYFVKFKNSVSLNDIASILTPYVFNMLGSSEHRTFAISTNDYTSLEKSLSGFVEYIEKESEIQIAANTNDSYYPDQWGLTATSVPAVWDYTTGSNDVSVCIIDTGFSNTHPDLKSDMFRQGWDYANGGEVFDDPDGHGTMVAGIIAADSNNYRGIAGINRNTFILPLKIPLIGEYFDTSKIIEALYDAGGFGCDVINMSLGGPTYSATFNSAIQYANSQGSIIVAAAGNEATEGNPISYPASYDNVISVGAVDEYLYRSYFSNYNKYVDVVAPGEEIITTNNSDSYSYVSGTSFSAPHVAGIAALIKSIKPDLTTNSFMDLIKTTSRDLGTTGYDNSYGYGLINATSMLNQLFKPSPITNLSAVYTNQTDSVNLAWGVSKNAIYYDVYRSTGNQLNFVKIGSGLTTNSYSDITYTSNSNIYYQVVGYSVVNGKNLFGQNSNTALISTPPLPPTITLNEGTNTINWNSVVGSEGYVVYQNGTEIANLPSSTLSYKLPGLESGYQYDFQVSSKKGNVAGKKSNIVTIAPKFGAPSNFVISDIDFDGFTLNWSPLENASITQYEILSSTSLNGVYTSIIKTTSTNAKLTGLIFNKEYFFKVRAIDNNGNIGLISSAVNGTTALKNITNLRFTEVFTNHNYLKWDIVPGASGYEVYFMSENSTTYTLAKSISTNEFSHYDLLPNSLYKYKVRSFKLVGTTKIFSNYSDVIEAKTLLYSTDLKYEPVDSHSFKLKWYKVPNATEYAIYVTDSSVSGFYREVARTFNNEIYLFVDDYSFYEEYHVKALSSDNESNLSNGVIGGLTPTTISNLNLETDFNSVKLTWNESVGAYKYDVYMGASITSINQLLGTVTSNSFETGPILNFNQTYFFTVIPTAQNTLSNNSSVKVSTKTTLKNPVDFNVVSPNATSADLSWSAVEGAAGYEISYSKGSSTTYTILRSVTTLTTNHTGLSVNTVFNYRVRAYRMAGTTKIYGGYSDVKSISTSTTNISKINLVFEPISNVEFKLKWNQISGATEYVIYQFTENNEENAIEFSRTSNTDLIISVNSLEDKYYYYVKSISSNSNEVTSNAVLAGGVPSPVENVVISAQFDRAHLSWDLNEDAASYDVYMSTNPTVLGNKIGSTILNEYNTGSILNYGHYYYFRIVPVSKVGLTTDLTKLPKMYIAQANFPTIESLNIEYTIDNKKNFTWNEVEGVDGYEIYYRIKDITNYHLFISINSNSYTLTSLSPDTNYLFKIRSFKQIGNSKIYSDFSKETEFLTPLYTPLLDVTNNASGEIVLNWLTDNYSTHYEIYVDNVLYKTVVNSKAYNMKETINNLAVAVNYEFKVVAINQNNRSLPSVAKVGMIYPKKVENIEVTSTNYNSVSLKWNSVEGAAIYKIYYGKDGSIQSSTTVNGKENATISNLLVNKEYGFIVVPQTIDGKGNVWSNKVYGTTKMDPIVNFSITTIAPSKVELKWDSVEGATGYIVTQRKVGGSSVEYNIITPTIQFSNLGINSYNFDVKPYITQFNIKEYGDVYSSNEYKYVKGLVSINETNKILNVGESFKLDASISPVDASLKDIKFASSDTSIATVDGNGLITAVSPGIARISATNLDNHTQICEVAVQLSFSGTGNQVIDNLSELNNGQYNNNYKVVATHTGSGSFVLNSYQNTEMKLKTVFDEIGNYEGENLLYDGYTKDFLDVDLEIITEGEWTIKIVPMAGPSTSTMFGNGDTVTRWVKDIIGTNNATFTYNGTDEFSLWKVIRNSSKTLINSGTGPTTTTFSVFVPQVDPYEVAFVIQGSGDWTINFNLGAEITQY